MEKVIQRKKALKVHKQAYSNKKQISLPFSYIKKEKSEFEKNDRFQLVVKFSCIFLLKLDKASAQKDNFL